MTEQQIRDLLREMHEDGVPVDSLARVRQSIEERTQQARRMRWLWSPWSIAALAAAAVCVILILWPRTPVKVPAAPLVPRETAAVQAPKEQPPAPAPPVVRSAQHKRMAPKTAENLTIRIETPDPDVVILLVGGED